MKIFTVFTGGTISCSSSGGVLSPDDKNGYRLLDMACRAGAEAEFVTAQPYTVLSENLCADNLKALRGCVEGALAQGFDKIIVTHGTDTLQYTAAYLDFVLGTRDLTLALVSANYPLSDSRSNGLDNFIAAVRLMESGERGVFVAYKNTGDGYTAVHRGREVMPHAPYSDSVFSLGESFGFVKGDSFERNPGHNGGDGQDFSDCELNGSVLWLRAYVGMSFPKLTQNIKAVLLESYHSGTLPTSLSGLKNFCENAKELGIPVYLTGNQDGFGYESKIEFDALGIKSLEMMSPIAAYVKLWLLDS